MLLAYAYRLEGFSLLGSRNRTLYQNKTRFAANSTWNRFAELPRDGGISLYPIEPTMIENTLYPVISVQFERVLGTIGRNDRI